MIKNVSYSSLVKKHFLNSEIKAKKVFSIITRDFAYCKHSAFRIWYILTSTIRFG